jgi:hypothetical protein
VEKVLDVGHELDKIPLPPPLGPLVGSRLALRHSVILDELPAIFKVAPDTARMAQPESGLFHVLGKLLLALAILS